jgi:hypothetical protein
MSNLYRELTDTEDGQRIDWYGLGWLGEKVELMGRDHELAEAAYQLGREEGANEQYVTNTD